MLRHAARVLGQIYKPYSFYSVEIGQFERKPALQILRFSTKPSTSDPRTLNKISEFSENDLKNLSSDDWQNHVKVLKSYRFLDEDCFEMIAKCPDILQIPLKKFENTVKQWSCSNLEMRNVHAVLLSNPILLDVENYIIRKRLSHLLAICGSSRLLTELLVKSPCVMFDDWNVVLEKFNYLRKVRGFHVNSIVGSCSLSQSLDFIKFRFDLLEKCGIYKQKTLYAHKINKYDQSQHQNPSLHDILDLNNKHFSRFVANISLEEYDVCYDLFTAAEESDADTDSDDD